jgi:hypothetical protein
MPELWESAPIVTVPRPACPWCGHESYIPIRSYQNGDGTSTKRAICKGCSGRYIVVREPLPKNGSFIFWPDRI